jgi:hypothetical protein
MNDEIERPETSRTALKEWAVACEALGRGDQILLLRKGGISEEGKHFRIEHPEFLLFPTYEHQRVDLLKPAAQADLEQVLASRGPSTTVEIRYWATVAEIFPVSQTSELEAIEPLHLWSHDYALERLRWKPRHPLQVIALRVYRLARATKLAMRPEFGGCKSWLRLEEPIAVADARPVLDDVAFAEQLGAVRRALGRTTAEVAG